MKRIFLAILISSFLAETSRAIEYDLPDPPNAMTFDTIPLRVVPVPNEKIPSTCDAKYRAGMESSFKNVWAQCQAIGKQEPSDCQRALFSRCTELATQLQKMEAQSCTAMLGESGAIAGFQKVDSQKTSQASNADLNARAYVATQRVIQSLETSAKSIDSHRGTAVATLKADACAKSTELSHYGKVEEVVGKAMTQAKDHLNKTIEVKKKAAAEFAKNSGQSQQNLAQLVSAAPAIVTPSSGQGTAAPAAASSTITSNERPPSSTSVTTVTTTTIGVPQTVMTITGTAPAVRPLPPAYYYDDSYEHHDVNWVPILAIGIPAAILTAIVVSKLSKNKIGDPPGGGDPGGGGGDPGPGGPPPTEKSGDPGPGAVPGDADLNALNIRIDPSFTDRQRAIIAAAVSKVPSCYRYKISGVYVQNASLPRLGGGRCVAGQAQLGGSHVWLSPSCRMAIGVTVHEFFHVMGGRNGNELHSRWTPIRNSHSGCPVTSYGATNFYEDFAESGRLALYPDSSLETQNPGACVQAKVDGLKQIMSSCPAGSK